MLSGFASVAEFSVFAGVAVFIVFAEFSFKFAMNLCVLCFSALINKFSPKLCPLFKLSSPTRVQKLINSTATAFLPSKFSPLNFIFLALNLRLLP